MYNSIKDEYLSLKRALFDKCYASLNQKQREAVFTVNNPLLILAGAGSGKTTVLVKRIVYIMKYGNAYLSDYVPEFADESYIKDMRAALESKDSKIAENMLSDFAYNPCPPYRILAITFTNKAANEIKARLNASFDDEDVSKDIWAGTFHSICMKILRVNCDKIGYKPGFTIYDADDTKKAVSSAMKKCEIDEKQLPIKSVIAQISKAKDQLKTPEAFAAENAGDFRLSKIAKVYAIYQKQLEDSNVLDFDDIIMKTVFLFKKNPDILAYYQKKFKYVCVDEYQDTNYAQFILTSMLAAGFRNLMVVGDDDQSIYKFRGATIENILNFDRTFDDAKVIKLEQNYRSTSTILDSANAVISNNKGRKGKNLWTDGNEGEKIILRQVDDQNIEARRIIDVINTAVSKGEREYRDFAVLYRTNAQSSSIERAFAKSAVPYRMLGGVRFSDRKEIRDVVAYLQLIANHADRERLLRIINEPKRKIGNVTLNAIEQIAIEEGLTMFEVIENASKYAALSRSAVTLEYFATIINRLTTFAESESLPDLFDEVLELSGYRKMLEEAGEEEKDRLDNLDEFKSSIIEYVNNYENPTLIGFLEENALVADVDRYDDSANAVVMMTIHSAKGLEFPIVILPGMEDGIFPGMQNIVGTSEDMEEERRLAYVAITRAKEKIYIFHTKQRLLYGQTQYNPISRFVNEIPEKYIDKEAPKEPEYYGGYSSMYGQRSTSQGANAGYSVQRPIAQGGQNTRSVGGYTPYKPQMQTMPPMQKVAITKPPLAKDNDAQSLVAGDRVRHMTFGEGEILSAKKMGADVLYEVAFDKVGTKKLMATYAKLKKI